MNKKISGLRIALLGLIIAAAFPLGIHAQGSTITWTQFGVSPQTSSISKAWFNVPYDSVNHHMLVWQGCPPGIGGSTGIYSVCLYSEDTVTHTQTLLWTNTHNPAGDLCGGYGGNGTVTGSQLVAIHNGTSVGTSDVDFTTLVGATIQVNSSNFTISSAPNAFTANLSGSPTSGLQQWQVFVNPSDQPNPRHPYQNSVFDFEDQSWVQVGGACPALTNPDIWRGYPNGAGPWTWTRVSTNAPAQVDNGVAAYDPDDHASIFLSSPSGITHIYAVCAPAHTSFCSGTANATVDLGTLTLNGYPARYGAAGAYIGSHKMIVYGGADTTTQYNDIWEVNLTTRTFTQKTGISGTPPSSPLLWSQAAWDSTRSRLYILTVQGQLTTYDYGTNAFLSNTVVGTGPDPDAAGSICYGPNVGAWCGTLSYDPTADRIFSYVVGTSNTSYLWSATIGAPTVNITVTAEEALYPGDPTGTTTNSTPPSYLARGGLNRTNANFCSSVALPDSLGLTSLSTLALSGVTAQQFRVLGTWPSGNYQWIEVCGTKASFSAGTLPTFTLTNTGSGTGANMATDNADCSGSHTGYIAINTGTACFSVKKANFNGIDTAAVGSTPMVLSGASDGFVIMGPNFSSPGTASVMAPIAGPYSIVTGQNDQLYLSAQNGSYTLVTLSAGSSTASSIAGQINAASISGLTASASSGQLVITSTVSGLTSSVGLNGDAVVCSSTGNCLPGSSVFGLYPGLVSAMAGCMPAPIGGSCTTAYKSSNDSSSTVAIEKNGPVEVSLKATWQYKDGSGNAYARGTARLYFHNQQSDVNIRPVLQNADFGSNFSFATTYKGMQSWEFRLGADAATLPGTLNYAVANHTGTPTSGTMSGSDFVTIYQGQSQYLNWEDCTVQGAGAGVCANYLTTDQGYTIAKNGSTLTSGSSTQYPQGWADVSTSGGVGIEIGAKDLAAHWPMSLEYRGGGTDIRVGLFASENSRSVYQAWPQWSLPGDFWLSFHTSAPASLPNTFLAYQHKVLGHASVASYNAAAVFPYNLNDPTAEDSYMATSQVASSPSVGGPGTACCVQDYGVTNPNFERWVYGAYSWHADGGPNQAEFRWSNLLNFIKRDMPGRYLDSEAFYEFQGSIGWAQSDGFTWSSHPSVLDTFGEPGVSAQALSYNTGLANCPVGSNGFGNCAYGNMWGAGSNGQEHWHGYGMGDYYFLSGDEFIKDSLVPMKDYFLYDPSVQGGLVGGSTGTITASGTAVTLASGTSFGNWLIGQYLYINGLPELVTGYTDASHISVSPSLGTISSPVFYGVNGGPINSRAVGVYLSWFTRYSRYLSSIGDGSAATVLANGNRLFDINVKSPLCFDGYPTGCTIGPSQSLSESWHTQGISPVRGVQFGSSGGGGDALCGYAQYYRVAALFQQAILARSILELRQQNGPGWSDYWKALDEAYAISQFGLGEQFVQTNNQWFNTLGNITISGTTMTLNSGTPFSASMVGSTFFVGTSNNAFVTVTAYTNSTHVSVAPWNGSATPANGSGTYAVFNGFRDGVFLDVGNDGAVTPNSVACQNYPPPTLATWWGLFYAQQQETGTLDQSKFNIALWRDMAGSGIADPDFGQYELSYTVDGILNPSPYTLQPISITSFTDNGGGSYTIGWTTPAGTQYLRVKWGPNQIVDLIGYDSGKQQWVGNPATTQNWFASPDAPSIPAPVAGAQSMTFTALDPVTGSPVTGLTASAGNFNVKGMFPAGASITPSTLPQGTVTQAYSQTLTGVGFSGTITWSLSAGSLPPGASGCTGTGTTNVISGTLTTPGAYSFTCSATDGVNTANDPLSITVNAAPSVTTSSLAAGTSTQTGYSQTISISGGTAPITCSADSGLTGSGLTVNSNCTVTGTVATAGGYTVHVTPTDSNSISGSAHAITLTVNARPSITTSSLPGGTVGIFYSQTLAATGGTGSLTWSVSSGALPGGLTLHSATGVIDGTPTTSIGSPFNFSVIATDSNGTPSPAANLSIGISGGTPATPLTTTTGIQNSGVIIH